MSLAQAVADRGKPSEAACCKLGALRKLMSEEDQNALDYAVQQILVELERPQDQRVFTINWLSDTLKANGYDVGRTTVKTHVHHSTGY